MKSLCSKIILSRWQWTHESKAVLHTLKLLFVRIASGILFRSRFFLPLRYHLSIEDSFSKQWETEFQMPNIMLHWLIKLCMPLLDSTGDIIWPWKCCFVVFFHFMAKLLSNNGTSGPVSSTKPALTEKTPVDEVSLAYLETATWKKKWQRSWLGLNSASVPPPTLS